MNKDYRYLVTGGAGFIGSHFVRQLIDCEIPKENIVVMDKLTYASDIKRLGDCSASDFYFYKGDICDGDLVDSILKRHHITCVVNFAAESHVDRSIEAQETFIQTNYAGVQNLLDRTYKFWQAGQVMDQALFVQISTDEVYGSSDQSGTLIFDETSPLRPANPYASTKAAADLMIGAYQNTYAYPAMIIRSTNNYGPGQNPEKFIAKIVNCLLNNIDIPLYGQGQEKRTWLHVKDNCHLIYDLICNGQSGEIYNVVGQTIMTNKALVELMIKQYQASGAVYGGQIAYVENRLGHDYFYCVSDEKLIKTLGDYCQIDFETGIEILLNQDEMGYISKQEVAPMFTKWNESLITGVDFMDKEHKEILLRAEQLHELLLYGHLAAYQKGLIELLFDYISTHFANEEELQKVIGFYLFEAHIAHHEAFRKRAKEIEDQMKHAILSKEELLLLDYEINEWIVDHIKNEDMEIADYHQHRKASSLNP